MYDSELQCGQGTSSGWCRTCVSVGDRSGSGWLGVVQLSRRVTKRIKSCHQEDG
jgi:hypothetical protein